eukprot:scaffold5892_cov112-Isochrysis_galbana.AAC.11
MLARLIDRAIVGSVSVRRCRSAATDGRTIVTLDTDAKPRVSERDNLLGEPAIKPSVDSRSLTGSHVGTVWKCCACSCSSGFGWRRVGYLFLARTAAAPRSRRRSTFSSPASASLPRIC